jgi:hypothetical protein
VTEEEIVAFVATLPGTTAMTASEDNGAPEVAWGDTFFFREPNGKLPFATLVVSDYPGFDERSRLDRPGVFRLNVGVGRERFEELVGYPPSAHAERAGEFDYTELDRLLPHPAYAAQAWVSILNPGERTEELARALLTEACARLTRSG